MRYYWLKIALGAVGVFTVGMLLITAVRRGKAGVEHIVAGSGPISLPVSFIPFRLDGERLGTMERVTILRSAPENVTGLDIVVDPSDSQTLARLNNCLVVAETADGFDPMTGFRCSTPADTVGRELVAFGSVSVQGDSTARALLVSQAVVNDLQEQGPGSRRSRAIRRTVDSLTRSADSLSRIGDSIREAVTRSIDSARVGAH